jgi:hypothetical protein
MQLLITIQRLDDDTFVAAGSIRDGKRYEGDVFGSTRGERFVTPYGAAQSVLNAMQSHTMETLVNASTETKLMYGMGI